ncbi:hypothetical protein BC826DRAFT_269463 [Russula brevipes]|nr:hypothetical protein BC826DRAFT_269463 [Russula brevipes]
MVQRWTVGWTALGGFISPEYVALLGLCYPSLSLSLSLFFFKPRVVLAARLGTLVPAAAERAAASKSPISPSRSQLIPVEKPINRPTPAAAPVRHRVRDRGSSQLPGFSRWVPITVSPPGVG